MNSTVTLPKTKNYQHVRHWDLVDIWKDSASLQPIEVKVDTLWKEYEGIYCWLEVGDKVTHAHFLHHLDRIMSADLSYPIILSEENYIMDGVHRLMKCKYLGITSIHCLKFKKDPVSKGKINA
jgi:disulfide oxidoreductase YuzD